MQPTAISEENIVYRDLFYFNMRKNETKKYPSKLKLV